jgi:hypothetical protein
MPLASLQFIFLSIFRLLCGGLLGLALVAAGCQFVTWLFRGNRMSRYQPCGPAAGISLFWGGPFCGALIVFLLWPWFPVWLVALLLLVSTVGWTWFASACASD